MDTKDSAPAGSGEVDLMVQQLEERAKWFREEKGHDATLLRQCAALLRKLSQAGSGEVEPLPVFSGNWIYVDTGQRFSGADLDGAAFAVYEPHLRKLQQGADYVMVPRELTERQVEAVCAVHASGTVWPDDYGHRAQEIRRTHAISAHRAMIAASQGQEGGK